MFMKNILKKLFVFVVLVSLLWSDVGYVFRFENFAYAAPRNLLTEYYNALKEMDEKSAVSLLNNGLNIKDATEATFAAVHARLRAKNSADYKDQIDLVQSGFTSVLVKGVDSVVSSANRNIGGVSVVSVSDYEAKFFANIFQALRKRGAKFTQVSYYEDLFSPAMPANLFKVIVTSTNKKQKSFHW